MLKKLKDLEFARYFIIGVLTTAVSLGSKYLLLFTILDAANPAELQLSVFISWVLAVLFAYFTNRSYVFRSKNQHKFREFTAFVLARVSTLLLEGLFLWFFITLLGQDTPLQVLIWTCLSQVLIFLGNYFLSKLVVFNPDQFINTWGDLG